MKQGPNQSSYDVVTKYKHCFAGVSIESLLFLG